MKIQLTEEFTFESAHRILNEQKQYGELHGHSHKVFVTISGEVLFPAGWIIDQHEFRQIVSRIIKRLDHRYLNEILDITTAEGIAIYLFKEIKISFSFKKVNLESVKVCKTTAQAEVSR